MRSKSVSLLVGISLFLTIAHLALGQFAPPGCCSCSCLPDGGGQGFETCTDIPAASVLEGLCDVRCQDMNCSFSFFANNTMCSDPSLASVCATDATMAPTASVSGLFVLVAALSTLGAFFAKRRRSA